MQDASKLRTFALWNTWLWTLMIPVTAGVYLFARPVYEQIQVPFILLLSLVALALSSFSWLQSARVEVKQDEASAVSSSMPDET